MSVIRLDSVSKRFELHPDRPRSFQDLVLRRLHRAPDPGATTLWALRDVSLAIGAGETVGLIGSNGSGKSTCLKMMTRILYPTSGSVSVQGRISALLELGAGFHPELTGRENILLNGSVLGISRREMMARFDDIVAFSELERFIDVPVKIYSSGMYVRLAFATAISVSPEILLVDEVLAVGDQSFQDKCLGRIRELRSQGVTIVLVSHDLDSIAALCDRVIWLDEGTLAMDGAADEVLAHYLAHVYGEKVEPEPAVSGAPSEPDVADMDVAGCANTHDASAAVEGIADAAADQAPKPVGSLLPRPQRWGSGRVKIVEVELRDASGRATTQLTTGAPAEIVIRYQAAEAVASPAFGIAIHRDDGVHISGCNTVMSGYEVGEILGEGAMRYQIDQLPLLAGHYALSVAIHNVQETEAYDYMSHYIRFSVVLGAACRHQGLVHIPAHWHHESGEAQPGGQP